MPRKTMPPNEVRHKAWLKGLKKGDWVKSVLRMGGYLVSRVTEAAPRTVAVDRGVFKRSDGTPARAGMTPRTIHEPTPEEVARGEFHEALWLLIDAGSNVNHAVHRCRYWPDDKPHPDPEAVRRLADQARALLDGINTLLPKEPR